MVRLSEDKKLIIDACSGERTFASSPTLFGSHGAGWPFNEMDYPSAPTPEIEIERYQMIKPDCVTDIFKSFSSDLEKLCLNQDQIITFCEKHPEEISRESSMTTFFLFKRKENVMVGVMFGDGAMDNRHYVVEGQDLPTGVHSIKYFRSILIPKLSS
ncbi:MAG: hypothetical protein JWM20_985 [Patescibacteria group bacterium]|nr:hypothetical protein [Patescibacteria group bacterium]